MYSKLNLSVESGSQPNISVGEASRNDHDSQERELDGQQMGESTPRSDSAPPIAMHRDANEGADEAQSCWPMSNNEARVDDGASHLPAR